MSVRVRLVLAAVFLLAGLALPWLAMDKYGAPWEFQERAAVVLSKTGVAEIHAGEERPKSEGTDTLPAEAGAWLYQGDEVRVASLSEVHLRTPTGDLTLGDGARAVMRKDAVSLARGLLLIEVPEEAERMRVGAARVGADVLLAPGRYRFTADGKGGLWVLVQRGLAATGENKANAGELLQITEGPKVVVMPAPKAVAITAAIDAEADVLEGTLPSGSALYVNGNLSYAEANGTFEANVPPGSGPIVLFARDPAGNVTKKRYKRPSRGMAIEELAIDEEEDNIGVVNLPDLAPNKDDEPGKSDK